MHDFILILNGQGYYQPNIQRTGQLSTCQKGVFIYITTDRFTQRFTGILFYKYGTLSC